MAVNDPEALLIRLLQEPDENSWLEFKENNCDPDLVARWVSACANAAILAGKERAFLIWGIKDKTKEKIGTTVRLRDLKKGAENFSNWISRVIEPRLMMEFLDFEHEGKPFAILAIEPTYDRPVRFKDAEYLRVGENIKDLKDFPPHELFPVRMTLA